MLPFTTGARPGKINMMSLPNSASSRLFPERKPSPTPTSNNKDPTPQAIPNIVRKERSLCAHRLRKICPKMSNTVRIGELLDTFHLRRTIVLEGQPFPSKRALARGCDKHPGFFILKDLRELHSELQLLYYLEDTYVGNLEFPNPT